MAIHILILLLANQPLDQVHYDSAIHGHGYGCVWSRQGNKLIVNTKEGRIELFEYELVIEGKCD